MPHGRAHSSRNEVEMATNECMRERSSERPNGGRPLDRVPAPDLMLIWPEEEGWPQEIGALAILDGRLLFDADG
jgi:hypothetical protein